MQVPKWLGNLLPRLASRAILALPLASMLVHGQSPGLSVSPDLISLQEIQQEEFEPAVGEQIRLAYHETLHDPRNAEVVGRLGMVLQCYRKDELAEVCYRRARTLSPGSIRWTYYLGNVEASLGKSREAIKDVRAALKIDEH